MVIKETKFLATESKGEVSGLLMRPKDAKHLLVFAHGASTHMRHKTMETIAQHLAEFGFATFRFNFPYSEHGRGRDAASVCTTTIRRAIAAAAKLAPDLLLLAGGHSFGGRMTSTAMAEEAIPDVKGLVFFSFPLHPAGEPAISRADHLFDVQVPMLFLTGSRDDLADLTLLRKVCEDLGKKATLHVLETADHSYKILKRARSQAEDVFTEMARALRTWIS